MLGVQLTHERAWQPRGGLNEDAFKRLDLVQSASNQSLLERLEAENARFEAVWWTSCSRFKHCATHSAIRSLQFDPSRLVSSTHCRLCCAGSPTLFSHSHRQLTAASFFPR